MILFASLKRPLETVDAHTASSFIDDRTFFHTKEGGNRVLRASVRDTLNRQVFPIRRDETMVAVQFRSMDHVIGTEL